MHRPRKRFGQNFLIDPMTIESLMQCIGPSQDDSILEIGPGKGALTQLLLKKLTELEVIELDRDLISYLHELAKETNNLIIYQGDALEFDFSKDKNIRRIVGNLPYNISTPLIFHLLNHINSIQDMHFMLQKEVVDRMCAQVGDRSYGRLSVMIQSKCTAEKLLDIAPEKFSPKPKVISSFVRLLPYKNPIIPLELEDTFKLLVKEAFSQPRKTIANNLKRVISADQLSKLGIEPTTRPQYISKELYIALAKYKKAS